MTPMVIGWFSVKRAMAWREGCAALTAEAISLGPLFRRASMDCKRQGEMRRWWAGLLGVVQLLAAAVGPALGQPQKLTSQDGAPMVLVPAGEFTMGSEEGDDDEKPIHRVYLDAFYMDTYEVTVE